MTTAQKPQRAGGYEISADKERGHDRRKFYRTSALLNNEWHDYFSVLSSFQLVYKGHLFNLPDRPLSNRNRHIPHAPSQLTFSSPFHLISFLPPHPALHGPAAVATGNGGLLGSCKTASPTRGVL